MTPDLPRKLQQLYDLLFLQGDVDIDVLFRGMEPGSGVSCKPREWLGPYITKLNRRLRGRRLKVVPGKLKRSYCLTTVD